MSINGVDATHAVGQWYFNDSPTAPSNHVDCQLHSTSPYACNPTCHQGQ